MGVMFLVLLPLPYIDASAASGFRSRQDRIVVGAAGMMVELAIGALATFAWVAMEPGLARSVAFNVMLAAGATTILFNANPLLRYDGYYMLSDATGIPNLHDEASNLVRHVLRSKLLGIEHGEPVLGTSLILPGDDQPISDPDDAMARLARRVDVVVDAGAQGFEPTTVIDMTGEAPQVTRVGRGPIDRMTG